jgi:glycosyltransferase involved in cell wall biosynthesis
MQSKISVCMATYNGEKYIEQQLCSILDQLKVNDEVIISDNGSHDQTLSLIQKMNDPRIRILHFNDKKGPIWNFENALKHALGDYIFLADQDDVWEESRVELASRHLQNNLLTVCNCKIINADGALIQKETFFEIKNSGPGLFKNMVSNTYLGCCLAFRKELLSKILPFPEDIPMHDWWIGLVASRYGSTYFIDKPGISYRRHGQNASTASEKSKTTLFEKFLFRYSLLKGLVFKH